MEHEGTKKALETCILAGGLSSRMGRDKSRLKLGGRGLLSRIRKTAQTLDAPVRVIRRDMVPRCGPLGGVYTALKTTSAEAILFLACDMPMISDILLRKLLRRSSNGTKSVFTWSNDGAGFPFVLQAGTLSIVEKLLAEKQFSLQALAARTRAKKFKPGRDSKVDLLNVNTPADWIELRKIFAQQR